MPKKKTNEEFLYDLSLISNTIVPLEKYINAKTKIKIKCLVCENEFYNTPDNLLRGEKCPICALKQRGLKRRKSHDTFVQEMNAMHPELIVQSQYKTSFDKVLCTCQVCGCVFNGTPARMLTGSGCPECANKKISQKLTKPYTQFKDELLSINPNIEIIGEYIRQSEHLCVKCNICHHEWSPLGTSLLSGFGCPMCSNSHGENMIDKYLHERNIEHNHQQEYNNLRGVGNGKLSYDFYLINYNLLIEYQGQFHDGTARLQTKEQFEVQQIHDKLKQQYAQDNNIGLLEIWYWDYNHIDDILSKTLSS